MADFSAADHRYMARALQLAARGLTTAHPNPRVGCVLVQGGEIVGEGWHRAAGEPHAEVNAIRAAGTRGAGAAAYVTLEPCTHTGRTGPCTNALVEAGIAEVVFAHADPSRAPESGKAALESAGVRVREGLKRAEARRLNEGFFSRIERGRPFVRVKIAASLDGGTAMRGGESRWITDDAARRDGQQLRAASGAILTGVGTVLEDDPSLTVRDASQVIEQPLRVILDSGLRTPPGARLLDLPGRTAIFHVGGGKSAALERVGVSLYATAAGLDGRVDPKAVLAELGDLAINDVLVEAGPVLSGALLAAGLADELVIYQAPHIMGSETRRMFETPAIRTLADRQALEVSDVRRLGACLRITARPADKNAATPHFRGNGE
jgi:diaminohydroxyphosphoribosylaminopyrimidine deaminase / 5-amino-6-(5-phosphoribosylamino)uracil reductase